MESSTTTGTGTYTLAGAITGYQSFAAVGNTNSCSYCAMEVDANGNASGGWEVGVGTYTLAGTTLSRDKIRYSTNANAAVSWAAGTRRIFLVTDAAIATPVISDFGGRLTTESGVPVSTSDRTAQGTIYYTPYSHNRFPKWDGSGWQRITFAEVSVALTVTSGKQYDIFFDGTTLSLSSAWTNDSTPADALSTQDGVPCLGSDHTKIHLGMLRASGANITEDSDAKRFLSNSMNQVPRRLHRNEPATTHTYSTATWREWNNGTGGPHRVQFVTGDVQVFSGFGWVELYGDAAGGAYCSLSLNDAANEGLPTGANVSVTPIRTGLSATYISAVGFNDLIVVELSTAIPGTFDFYRLMAQILG